MGLFDLIFGQPPRFPNCADCGRLAWDVYMVHDAVWARAVGAEVHIDLHLVCLEKRLRRRLGIHDFPDLPCNENLLFGYRMGCRS